MDSADERRHLFDDYGGSHLDDGSVGGDVVGDSPQNVKWRNDVDAVNN